MVIHMNWDYVMGGRENKKDNKSKQTKREKTNKINP